MSVIYLAGGCFWGVQKYFDQFDGIIKTTVGYANGHTENPMKMLKQKKQDMLKR